MEFLASFPQEWGYSLINNYCTKYYKILKYIYEKTYRALTLRAYINSCYTCVLMCLASCELHFVTVYLLSS